MDKLSQKKKKKKQRERERKGALGSPEAGAGSVVADLLQEGTPHRSDKRSGRKREAW